MESLLVVSVPAAIRTEHRWNVGGCCPGLGSEARDLLIVKRWMPPDWANRPMQMSVGAGERVRIKYYRLK
jgi:hypothetical protein